MKKIIILLMFPLLSFQVCAKKKNKVVLSPEDEKIMKSLDDDTLLGPDKNGDGVRDDVEYWIKKYTKDVNVKKASLLYAKYYREMRRNVHSREESNKLMRKQRVVGSCLYLITNFDISSHIEDQIDLLVNNSKIRINAYLKANNHYRGQTYSTSGNPAREVCPFKLVKM